MTNKHLQRGVSLPAMAIAVVIMALVLVAVARERIRASKELAGTSLGVSLNELGNAVELYRTDNLSVLTGVAGGVVIGVADPYAPTTAELQSRGYLAQEMNFPAGEYSIAIAKNPAGCVAPVTNPCTVWSRVAKNTPVLEPDGSMSADRLNALVASVTTSSASFSGPPNPATIVGGDGTWTIANPDATARSGIVVLVNGMGGGGAPYLVVGDTRNPNFRGPSVTGTQFDTPIKVPGDACAPQGAFASAANGIVYCNASVWMVYSGPIETGGAACTIEGAFGVSPAGASLICISSVWRDHATYGQRGSAYYAHGSTVAMPSCGVGLTPVATVASVAASVIIGANNAGNNTGSFDASIATPSNLVSITGADGSIAGTNAKALVLTSCAPV